MMASLCSQCTPVRKTRNVVFSFQLDNRRNPSYVSPVFAEGNSRSERFKTCVVFLANPDLDKFSRSNSSIELGHYPPTTSHRLMSIINHFTI